MGLLPRNLWCSALLILLLPVTIVLLSFPLPFSKLGLFQGFDASWIVRGLLSVMWIVLGVTFYQQRSHLRVLRNDLIAQLDRATRSQVRAEQFYGMSILDPLTGLYNRRFGETRLAEEIKRAQGSREPLIVLAIDFDRFKHINDKYGHAGGDLALKEFSRRLQRAVRACDVPIRIGGDEFLVILSPTVQRIRSRRSFLVWVRLYSPRTGNRSPCPFRTAWLNTRSMIRPSRWSREPTSGSMPRKKKENMALGLIKAMQGPQLRQRPLNRLQTRH